MKNIKEQGLWISDDIEFTDVLSLDMSTVVPTISGPKEPQDKVLLSDASENFKKVFKSFKKQKLQSQKLKMRNLNQKTEIF